MALIVEDGSGVIGANAYINTAFVTAYLTSRNRLSESNWGTSPTEALEGAIIEATDYVEQRFRTRFKGTKEYRNLSQARAVLTLTNQPTAGQQVTIGTISYTFGTTVTAANDVLIGANTAESIANLVKAILADSASAGTAFGTGTVAHPDVQAFAFYGLSMVVIAQLAGEVGNTIVTTTDITGASFSFATLNGGNDINLAQPLSFPRRGLFDRDGVRILGIPPLLQHAVAEYAVRANSATLLPDPTIDARGRSVISVSERLGPIQTSTTYAQGTTLGLALRRYPAADQLLKEFLWPTGGTFRG